MGSSSPRCALVLMAPRTSRFSSCLAYGCVGYDPPPWNVFDRDREPSSIMPEHVPGSCCSRWSPRVTAGQSSFVTLDCALTPFRDTAPGERSFEPVETSDCVFRVEACLDRHDAAKASSSQQYLDPRSTIRQGTQLVSPIPLEPIMVIVKFLYSAHVGSSRRFF